MSIMVCRECESYVDTDFHPMSDDGLCAACEDASENDLSLRDTWVSIRGGQIVGTPFGPEVPDGKYKYFARLASQSLAQNVKRADADTLLSAALQRLSVAAAEAIRAGSDTTAHPTLNRQKLREISRLADEIFTQPNVD